MKEAIANAGVFNLMTVFIIILLAFFVGSLSYSKAFKVKNNIVDEIEKDQGYETATQDNIEKWLGQIGYRVNNDNGWKCPDATEAGGERINNTSNYQYCVYRFDTCSKGSDKAKCGTYYRVIAYMYFDVPIINDLIKIPVMGETVTFNEINS